jgi:hypothetical protein
MSLSQSGSKRQDTISLQKPTFRPGTLQETKILKRKRDHKDHGYRHSASPSDRRGSAANGTSMDRALHFYIYGLGFAIQNRWVLEDRVRWC